MSTQGNIVIVSAVRTPLGTFQGALSPLSGPELGACAIKGALDRIDLEGELVSEVFMGCVLPAGTGQAPARQAALGAGLPFSAGATTINKVCGSGMKAVMLAHDLMKAGNGDVMVAGGMESMSNAPYLLPKARAGFRMGHGEIKDAMFLDGLEDAYDKGKLMGVFAQETADEYGFSREAQDNFALESLRRAKAAQEEKAFHTELVPVTVVVKGKENVIESDEGPAKARPEKIPTLKPAFKTHGTITAANASSISDGAAALVLMTESKAAELGLKPLARIVAHATHSRKPSEFTIAPVGAIRSLLDKTAWSIEDVDLFEINEAFAMVTMAAMKDLQIPHEKVNVHGGACALGHPLGATGARIIVTLLHALHTHGGKRGVAALCIGGGEATAIAIEREDV
jgi:acetyl-CoA C-acetyltransferase